MPRSRRPERRHRHPARHAACGARRLLLACRRGETLCLVGESGCGKSMTSLAIMGLLPQGGQRAARGASPFAAKISQGAPEAARQRLARQPHGDDLPGADDRAQPGLHDRQPAGGSAIATIASVERRGGARPRGRLLGKVGIASAAERARPVSAPALRRPAPARHDRDGADVRARRC